METNSSSVDATADQTDPSVRMGRELMGLSLRAFLTLHMLDSGGPVRVRDMAQAIEQQGFTVAGRPSKVISDGLRWEIVRGRVERLGRGLYRAIGKVPRTTLRRMRQRVEDVATSPEAPVRIQPLWPEPRPLVSPDGPWRYRRRYGIKKPPTTPWGYGWPMPKHLWEPGPTKLLESMRKKRRELEILRRSQPFGPHMV